MEDDDENELDEEDETDKSLTRAILWEMLIYHQRKEDRDIEVYFQKKSVHTNVHGNSFFWVLTDICGRSFKVFSDPPARPCPATGLPPTRDLSTCRRIRKKMCFAI